MPSQSYLNGVTASSLTRQAYSDIGGVSGALARRADELFESLSASDQKLTQQIFLRLVTLGDGVEHTRRRTNLAELLSIEEADEAIQNILDQFGKFRLLTFDNDPTTRAPTVEVAHEALIPTVGSAARLARYQS